MIEPVWGTLRTENVCWIPISFQKMFTGHLCVKDRAGYMAEQRPQTAVSVLEEFTKAAERAMETTHCMSCRGLCNPEKNTAGKHRIQRNPDRHQPLRWGAPGSGLQS